MTATRIPVGGERPYEVVVGTGVLGELPGLVGDKAGTAFVIHAGSVAHIAYPVRRALEDAGYRVVADQVPDGEEAKQVPVAAGEPFIPDEKQREGLGITRRELEILELIAQGMSNREIAEKLYVSENTVKTHSSRVFSKLGAKRRTQAVQLGKEFGLLP